MKKIFIILLVIGGAYYYFKNNVETTQPKTISELVNSNMDESNVLVTGRVERNFKLFYGVYELKDINTGETIMVSTTGKLPKVGSNITKRLKKNDVITFNDKTFSLFKEIE